MEKMQGMRALIIALPVALLHAAPLALPLSLSQSVSSSMVLQRDVPTQSIWGFATAGAAVITVLAPSVPGSPFTSTTGADGIWRVALPALPASAAPMNLTFSSPGAVDVTITDVLVGDVILCSGQSNMQLSIQMGLNATAELAAADAYGPALRVLYVGSTSAAAPATDLAPPSIAWARASGAVLGKASWAGFSALCWFTGRDLFNALGGAVPVGLVESCVGGTAIRQWVPAAGLARCPQPYNSPVPYGIAPYGHSLLYNGMIAPLATGPTALRLVLWDQAESDSFPQTPAGYYGCQTVAQINAWRAALRVPLLPWVFLHLQPYTGSGPCCLEELRSQQLAALQLPAVGYATAMDLGDMASPYGNVHFRNKQAAAARVVAAALVVAYSPGDAPGDTGAYPPPSFLTQEAFFDAASNVSSVDVTLDGAGAAGLMLLPAANVTCPAGVDAANCSAFAVLGSDGGAYPAVAALAGPVLRVTSASALPPGVYGVGTAYGWAMWPLVPLFTAAAAVALPVLPWRQALTLAGPPGPRPSRVRLHYQATGLCLATNASGAFPCAGGWGNSCPAFLGACDAPESVWLESPTSLRNEAVQRAVPGAFAGVNVDCNRCEAGRVAKVARADDDGGIFPVFQPGGGGALAVPGCGGASLCLDGGQGAAVPTCEPGEAVAAAQVQLAPCGGASAQGWAREELLLPA